MWLIRLGVNIRLQWALQSCHWKRGGPALQTWPLSKWSIVPRVRGELVATPGWATERRLGGTVRPAGGELVKTDEQLKPPSFFFSPETRARSYFLLALQHLFESLQRVTFILGSARQDFHTRRGSRVSFFFCGGVLLFATFYPRPPRAHFLPAGPKIEACAICVAAVGCESLQFLLRGCWQRRLLCDASFHMFFFFHYSNFFPSRSFLFNPSLAMNHLSERVSEMSQGVKDEDVFEPRPSSV